MSPNGKRVAFVEADGTVHVFSTVDGSTIATTRVRLENAESDSVHLIAEGQFLAVKSSTPSGAVPWTLSVYPVAADAEILYGAEGIEVDVSPYHDMVLGLQGLDKLGVQLTTAVGVLGFIPYEYQPQIDRVRLASSADGQFIYIATQDKGLDVYSRDLKKVFHLDVSPSIDIQLSPVAKVIWHDRAPGVTDFVDAGGKVKTITFDPKTVSSGRVMPGGEKVFQVESAGQRTSCVVTGNGTIFGCFPFVGFSSTIVDGRTFFWARLQDGTIAAYTP
ncbi:MAG TPA: hypothetical protein VD973_22625 [Symbiobacteriaceae bacterium]|nr:hypothetical protein [Symbiobacteriaceae bacterium]